ncbi:MAG: hypothetical protein OEO83_09185 [Alphaproteobacteria bacterium]|nr:hypothetical protein [Alphaproteobacteria bacterium]
MRGAALLLVLCLGLGAAIAYQQLPVPGGAARPAGTAAPVTPRAVLPEIKEVPEAAYGPIVEANLFDPARRPTAEPPPSRVPGRARAVPGQPPFELKGVITMPQGRLALIRTVGQREYRQVVKGETIEGWVVQSIGADRISVKKADTATVLELKAPQPGLRRPAPRRKPPSARDRRER